MAGVEIPAAWLLIVDSFAYNPFSRVGWMVWLWKGREGKGREGPHHVQTLTLLRQDAVKPEFETLTAGVDPPCA